MYLAERIVLSKSTHLEIYALADRNACLAKQLYNAALFRLRQTFTGWEKESRTDNEKEVFRELSQLKLAYPSLSISRVLSYRALEKLMRVTHNPDFFSGLPMQTAQAIVKAAAADFGNWLKALKAYREDPARFSGKPRMPHYCKNDRKAFTITNQDAVLYPVLRERKTGKEYTGMELKLPGIRSRMQLPHLAEDARLKEVKVCPYYGKYILTLVLEAADIPRQEQWPHLAGIDLGVDNIAAIVTTDHGSRVYKGGAVLASNRLFHKEKAKAVGILTKGTRHKHVSSRHLDHLSRRHDGFVQDTLHKISADIISFCQEHQVGTIVIGTNPGWKQGADLGRRNNQNFVSIPHEKLRWMILYKAQAAGIAVVLQEESYTSRADASVRDPMPEYGKEEKEWTFSGKRIRRGLYRCRDGLVINADCNGAANILRKAFPNAWGETKDYRFLACPSSVTFKALNRCQAAG